MPLYLYLCAGGVHGGDSADRVPEREGRQLLRHLRRAGAHHRVLRLHHRQLG